MIHQDAHAGNFFVNDKGQITLFDFDDSLYGHFVYDLAMVLFYAVTNREDAEEFVPLFWEAFLLTDNNEILGTGECRISETQKPFADIGMITNNRHRRLGIGAFLLAQLKEYCYSQQVKPICSCAFDNIASRKTIEKAGFVTQHRILNIQFH